MESHAAYEVLAEPSPSSSTLEELPFETLVGLSEYFDPKDLISGLAATNQHFRVLFAEESYWEDRVRRASKNYHAAVLGRLNAYSVVRLID